MKNRMSLSFKPSPMLITNTNRPHLFGQEVIAIEYRLKGSTNLKKLRNIMITWVWENIEIGYVQGMCDILAPLLVILDNEALTHACFTKLMKRMIHNFPQMGSNMDENLRTMALLLQIIDGDLYDHMCHDGEVTSLYVTYRWFLLDFKRGLCYSDVFSVWETIWSAGHVASSCFNLFLALSLLYYYRDIILDNNMEYTDIIKFFNEMAEKHQVQKLLYIAREFIETIRDLLKPR
uniref:Small G protein signaling modulator-1 n=1 Tax=Schmidtea mediterranea TaxID=79327 RepID=I1ZIA4_SCHMD|nr:small G protein signaling modulator-1 [Schmidtea mediterranea]